jgi:hypothetical protein
MKTIFQVLGTAVQMEELSVRVTVPLPLGTCLLVLGDHAVLESAGVI